MGVTLKVTTPKWIRSTLPRLQTLFHQKSNSDGVFPILSPEQTEKAFQSVQKQESKIKAEAAAVLVPIVSVEGTPSVLFTKRSQRMREQPGQISFPGGHVEEGETYVDAAIRECQEEVGGPWATTSSFVVIGECTPLPSIRGLPVIPVLGILPEELHEGSMIPNPEEVDEVFTIGVKELLETESSKMLSRIASPAPVWPTPHGDIWGLTAFILRPILRQLLKPVFVDAGGASFSATTGRSRL